MLATVFSTYGTAATAKLKEKKCNLDLDPLAIRPYIASKTLSNKKRREAISLLIYYFHVA
jgi:hypothetical protein